MNSLLEGGLFEVVGLLEFIYFSIIYIYFFNLFKFIYFFNKYVFLYSVLSYWFNFSYQMLTILFTKRCVSFKITLNIPKLPGYDIVNRLPHSSRQNLIFSHRIPIRLICLEPPTFNYFFAFNIGIMRRCETGPAANGKGW